VSFAVALNALRVTFDPPSSVPPTDLLYITPTT
jgi:hypothetical protein